MKKCDGQFRSKFSWSPLCLFFTALLVLTGCNALSRPVSLPNASTPLATPTYDGSGQGMHPGIVAFRSEWHGYRYWMAMTPYPNDNNLLENPSILASRDGITWVIPAGLSNPVAPFQPVHQMDPDLFYDAASGQLWLYYMRGDTHGNAVLLRRTSADGVNWSDEIVQATVPYNTMVSPAVDKTDSTYKLWSVNPAAVGCNAVQTQVELRSSPDSVSWSAAQVVNLRQPGFEIWHLEVAWVEAKKEYWAVYAAYPDGSSCGGTSLFFATSKDGLTWTTFARPLLSPGNGWDSSQVYRASFLYDATEDMLKVWYSAQHSHVWHIGYTQRNYAELLNYLNQR